MMNCQQARQFLHAYADRELDLAHSIEIEEHLSQCPECSKLNQGVRTLKSAISSNATYYRAPKQVSLIQEQIASGSKTKNPWRIGKVPVTLVTSLIIGLISFSAGQVMHSQPDDQKEVDLVVAAHIRSLLVVHAVDVASTDRHTVKPWFQGKLDYAPQVINLTDQGFNLHGGRLDYLTDRPVAAIVYYRRSHAINLFTWPISAEKDTSIRKISTQGYHVRNWQQQGMTYWAISDLNDAELDQFVEMLNVDHPVIPQKP